MTDPTPPIELWLVDCDRCGSALELVERDVPRLTKDDRTRAQAIGDPHERSRRLAAYTALRLLIERVAGPAVRGQPIVRAPGSKPLLGGGSAGFNLSHTDAHALIGVSRGQPLGVDIEKLRPARMSERRMAEIVALGAGLGDRPLPRSGSGRRLLQAWARLEAFAKARGAGLAQTLADAGLRGKGRAHLPPAQVQAAARRLAAEAGLAVHDLRLPLGLCGAVAAPRGIRLGRVRTFPPARAAIDRLLAERG
jgi:4'-phosphopantetheinyl transferase